jgi:hypothetical protein
MFVARLVDIEDAEREIKSLAADLADPRYGRLLQIMSEITAMLGTDELIVFAIDDWANQLVLSHESTELHRATETKQHAQHLGERTDILIARTVEELFDLLPGIRAERRAYFYDEEIRRENETRGREARTLVTGFATVPTIEKQFEDAKFVISARDNRIRSEGRNDILEPTFAKVQARLEEFKNEAGRTAKPAADEQAKGSPSLQPKLEEMSKTLGATFLVLLNLLTFQATFLDKVKSESFTPHSKSTDDLKSPSTEKQSRPQLDKMANEELRDFIARLDSDMSELWSAGTQGPAV